MRSLTNNTELAQAATELFAREPRFGFVVANHGLPPLRLMPAGLSSLLRIVTDQLISLKAGEAIWRRLETRLEPFAPQQVLACSESELMSLGLSGAKARTFLAAAKAADDGLFDLATTSALTNTQALERLMTVPGVGPWTADIYLLSAMGRADAWPSGDLALQVAAQHLFDLPERPSAKAMKALATPWSPIRSVAARLLWSHYRGLKGLPQSIT